MTLIERNHWCETNLINKWEARKKLEEEIKRKERKREMKKISLSKISGKHIRRNAQNTNAISPKRLNKILKLL